MSVVDEDDVIDMGEDAAAKRNIYGCLPCLCGSVYRYGSKRGDELFIVCDDCGSTRASRDATEDER